MGSVLFKTSFCFTSKMVELIRKLFTNKKTNQRSITLPKDLFVKIKDGKKIKLNPDKLKIKDFEFEFK